MSSCRVIMRVRGVVRGSSVAVPEGVPDIPARGAGVGARAGVGRCVGKEDMGDPLRPLGRAPQRCPLGTMPSARAPSPGGHGCGDRQ